MMIRTQARCKAGLVGIAQTESNAVLCFVFEHGARGGAPCQEVPSHKKDPPRFLLLINPGTEDRIPQPIG